MWRSTKAERFSPRTTVAIILAETGKSSQAAVMGLCAP
jgi:hypothetical protein